MLAYKKDYGGLHPTQKPVALIEDLIKSYTIEGYTVLATHMARRNRRSLANIAGSHGMRAGRYFQLRHGVWQTYALRPTPDQRPEGSA